MHLEGDVRSQVKGNLIFGLLLVPLNSCFKTFVIFNDWLFPHEVVILCKGISTSALLVHYCIICVNSRLIEQVLWFLEKWTPHGFWKSDFNY